MTSRVAASIVIPTFNRSGLLRRAIDTALDQTVPCEVIVSDHGSDDDTPAVVESYGSKVSYFRRAKDNGPFFAWLDGIINSTSEYVHITHDDDWIDHNFIESCVSLFTDDCCFVFTDARVHWQSGNSKRLFENLYETGIHSRRKIESKILSMSVAVSPGCAVFRKEDLLPAIRVGGLPLANASYRGVGADMLMFLLPLLKYPKFGFVNQDLAHFLAHPGSITVDASGSLSKTKELHAAYREVKYYYLRLKAARYLPLAEAMYGWSKLKARIKKPFRGTSRKSKSLLVRGPLR
jgi:glycosyltransferase involved in cell wall biosynthesis